MNTWKSLVSVAAILSLAGPLAAQTPAGAPRGGPANSGRGTTSLVPPADAPPATPGTPGPYKVMIESPASLKTHTLCRPDDLKAFTGAKKLPIIAWGNGACSNAGLLFETFLTGIASHGYFIVVSGPKDAPLPAFASARPGQSANPPPPARAGAAPQPMTTDADMKAAIDWATAQAKDKTSPFYGHIDPTKVAVMGQSCGGLTATALAADPRVKAVMIWNSGLFPDGTTGTALSKATKASLALIHTPIAYINGGPADAAYLNAQDDASRIKTEPVFLAWVNVGHGGTYNHPNGGRFADVGVDWLDWQLKGDKAKAKMFTGADCGLCQSPIWHVEKHLG